MGVEDRRRHQLGGFVAGVAEHDALVAGALVLRGGGVDALGDVGRLGVQQHLDGGLVPVEAVLLVADVLHRHAGMMSDEVAGHGAGAAVLAGDDDAICRRQRLASHPHSPRIEALRLGLAEEEIDDLVGDAVADLVRMTFGHGLAGEEIVRSGHGGGPLLRVRKRRRAALVRRPRSAKKPARSPPDAGFCPGQRNGSSQNGSSQTAGTLAGAAQGGPAIRRSRGLLRDRRCDGGPSNP